MGRVYWDYMGILENTMEATIVYWGHIGIMERKIEKVIQGLGCLSPQPHGPMRKQFQTTTRAFRVARLTKQPQPVNPWNGTVEEDKASIPFSEY